MMVVIWVVGRHSAIYGGRSWREMLSEKTWDTAPYSRESGEGCNRLHNDAIASRLVKLPVRNTWEM